MIRLALILLLVAAISYSLYWLALNSGTVCLQALGYQVDTTFPVLVVLLTLAFIAFYICTRVVVNICLIPKSIKHFILTQQQKNTQNSLTRAIYYLLSQNFQAAAKCLESIKVANPDNSKGLYKSLISIAKFIRLKDFQFIQDPEVKSSKIANKARLLLITKKYLGVNNEAVSLYISEFENYAEDAVDYLWLLYFNIYLQRFEVALKLLKTSKLKYFASAEVIDILNGALVSIVAQNYIDNSQYSKAISILESGEKNAVNVKLLLKSYLATEEYKRAEKFLRKWWNKFATLELAVLAIKLQNMLKPEVFYKLGRDLKIGNESSIPSLVIHAKAALGYEKYNEASKSISELLNKDNSFASILMAEYCLSTHSSKGETLEWIKRTELVVENSARTDHYTFLKLKTLEKLLDN
jgi:uncharacterized membrane-anchored protein